MDKMLVLSAVIFAFVWSPIPISGQTPDHGSQGDHRQEGQASPKRQLTSPTITLIEKNCDSEAFKNDPDCKKAQNGPSSVEVSKLPTVIVSIQKNAERDTPDWIAYGGDLLLVGVGIGTLIAVWKQAKRMKEHAEELKKVASAALLNAQAIISSERAWVVASRPQDPYIVNREQWHRREDYRETKCTLSLINAGRTPARILTQRVELQEGESSENPPDGMVFESVMATENAMMLVPNEPIEIPARLLDNFATKASNPLPEGVGPQTAIEAGDLYLWLCGYVKYNDVLQKDVTHELRFCYLWDVVWSTRPRWIPGPTKYNSGD